jgi:hypothetical protein
MGNYLSSLEIFPERAQVASIAEALRQAAASARVTSRSFRRSLRRALRRHLPTAPTLRFDDELTCEYLTNEPEPWPGFADRGAMGVELAMHVIELHTGVAKRLDAAEYALVRLRLELEDVAPGLLGSSLPSTMHQPPARRRSNRAPPNVSRRLSAHNGLAAA